ncbi:DUF3011 domain-containing protein [Tunturiibacter gelidiferens]
MKRTFKLLLTGTTLIAGICAIPATAAAQPDYGGPPRITCSSDDGRRNWCDIGPSRDVRMARQISGSPCIQDDTWGVDRRGLWVDRGCRAEFILGRREPPPPPLPSPAPPTMAAETGAISAPLAMSAWRDRSAARPVSRMRLGASIHAASGSTADAAPTSSFAQDHHLLLPLLLPAPPITETETGVTLGLEPKSDSSDRSADLPAFAARPGTSTIAASG